MANKKSDRPNFHTKILPHEEGFPMPHLALIKHFIGGPGKTSKKIYKHTVGIIHQINLFGDRRRGEIYFYNVTNQTEETNFLNAIASVWFATEPDLPFAIFLSKHNIQGYSLEVLDIANVDQVIGHCTFKPSCAILNKKTKSNTKCDTNKYPRANNYYKWEK